MQLDTFIARVARGAGLLGAMLLAPGVSAQAIDYDDFSDLSALTLNGDTAAINAAPVSSGGQVVLRLTDGLSQSGSAFLTAPISLAANASFSTRFSFQLTDGEGIGTPPGADGFVFVVQTVANTAGGGGAGIGYAGIGDSLGIEFDTFDNGGPSEIDGNHVGVNLDGNVESVASASVSPEFNDGSIWTAWVDYDGAAQMLEVRVAQSGVRPTAPLLAHGVDLVSVLGQTDAFVGFTSATGDGANDHDIREWAFQPFLDPFDQPAAAPATIPALGGFGGVILAALLALGSLRARKRRKPAGPA